MRCGLFGKLSAKRDYISIATPRNFLAVWEPWTQACMSASQHQLGPEWQNVFLAAPIWRFWIGSAVCGASTMGAIMPSIDGVARYYPLTLHAIADADATFLPPDADPQEAWFASVEQFLLSTLDSSLSFEDISSALEALAIPAQSIVKHADIIPVNASLNAKLCSENEFAMSLSALRAATPETSASASFWWTAGGDNFPAMAMCCRGLPDPYDYTRLLSGNLQEAV